MRFAEILREDGCIDQSNLRSALAADVYILRGDPAGEHFEPHFTYHGFRYVQVTGYPGVPTMDDLEGVVIHSDLAITGRLRIENEVVERLWRNTLWSQRSNFMGIPTDCPQRDERLGWLGDANVFWGTAAFNMDVAAFTRRFMGDVRDAQASKGAFSDFCPAAFKFQTETGPMDGSPGWADAGVSLPWTTWRFYGDTAVIDENWEAMARYLQSVRDANPDFVWRKGRGMDFGDWLALDEVNPGDPTTPKDLVATALWAHSVDCMAQMAAATGRWQAAKEYRTEWARIASAFQSHFVKPSGAVGNGSQTGYILALHYNLAPESLRAASAAKLAADIVRRGALLSTGFLGTPISLDVLADTGFNGLVYELLLRTEFPSWGYMASKGATTIWERWNGDRGDPAMNSFNHYALGAVCGFMFRRIAGIAALEPGFRRIAIRPIFDPRVKAGGADYDSVLGRISTAWRQFDEGQFTLEFKVPPNAEALVHLPATRMMKVEEGGKPVKQNPDIRLVERTAHHAIVETGSGVYRFVVTKS
jgi:alpha-L-rhamnosidase